MRRILLLITIIVSASGISSGIEQQKAQAFLGQDLHLAGRKLVSYQLSTGEHSLVFQDSFSMSIGANHFFSDKAVVWLESETIEYQGRVRVDYKARIYLRSNVTVKKGSSAKTVGINQTIVENGYSMIVRFDVDGEVFVTADEREQFDPRQLELYQEAINAMAEVKPKATIQPEAVVPQSSQEKKVSKKKITPSKAPDFIEAVVEQEEELSKAKKDTQPKPKKLSFKYPVNLSPAGESQLEFETAKTADKTEVDTIIGQLYVWQKQDEKGGLLELRADNTVIFRSGESDLFKQEGSKSEDILTKGNVRAIYMSGNVIMTEGQRTIRADEIYYDFERKKALAVNAVMRNYDVQRQIPIYIRAAKLHQVAENKFAAENIILTNSEFYQPQVSLSASSVIITDTTTIDAQAGMLSDSSYEAEMSDVRLKLNDTTLFYWPFMRANLERPDTPLKSLHAGYDNTWGTSFESNWYLSRLLGLQEPDGVDSTVSLDYFSKRGFGSGAEIDYERDNYFGNLVGYVISDRGEDDLGRHSSRANLEPDNDIRGRIGWRHRQFLPENWQLTAGVSYISDENFLEQYYRRESNIGPGQETYINMKRQQDNWALDILAKGRLNDFADELEEMPSVGYHLMGQSLFDDKFTFYSDTEVAQLRQKTGRGHPINISSEWFSFVSHRSELDMPFSVGAKSEVKVVPFVAGNFGFDDRSGFTRTLVDGSRSGSFGEKSIWIGEAGIRASTQFWKVYPNVRSRLWDLEQLRHIIRPTVTAVHYEASDSVADQRDMLNLGVSQRLQTRRGGKGSEERTVDWMRLDIDLTWVEDQAGAGTGPDRFIWNEPIVPMRVLSAPEFYNSDLQSGLGLQRFEMFGPRRNYFSADYLWRISDTTAVLSDMNYDLTSGLVQQFNIGFSRLSWPNLQFYVGTRYLKRVAVLNEKGSNAFTFAATYIIDPRYTIIFAQQYDFEYKANIRSDITLVRRYHRVCWGLTFSADESLDRQSLVFSVWPMGVPEMALGSRRYADIAGASGY
jgi:hypothetical protein